MDQHILRNKTITTIAGIATALLLISACGDNSDSPSGGTATTATPRATVTAPFSKLSDLQWLAGHWQTKVPDGIVFEDWVATDATHMSGKSGFIRENDTSVSETISLEQQGGKLLYIPTVKDQNGGQPVPFTLSFATADSFVFANPAHDFPQFISYKKLSSTSLVARISGTVDGKERSEDFPMERVR